MSSLSPDPTLTVENVTRAMEKVAVDKRRRVWEAIFNHDQLVQEIYSSHSNEEEKLHSCADTYVTCAPSISWKELIAELYYWREMAAAREAKAFLQHKGGFNGTSLIVEHYWASFSYTYRVTVTSFLYEHLVSFICKRKAQSWSAVGVVDRCGPLVLHVLCDAPMSCMHAKQSTKAS